jgi:glyoxylase-like metal-dependent hydrolase (beta-lactamase superfamily II)
MRALVKFLGLGIALIVVGALLGLTWAHVGIRGALAPLPGAEALSIAAVPGAALPVRLSYVNTASQRTTRAGVLEASLDPDPDTPYTMSVPAFVLEWADGRIFLIDLGMDREPAAEFGRPSELLFDADPMVPLGGVAEQLGDAATRVAGVAFTHLHTDHTNGAKSLCAAARKAIPLFQSSAQNEQTNYTTRPGAADIDSATCLEPRVVLGEGVRPVPGFAGLGMLMVGGHTPGSQVFVARMAEEAGGRTWIFTGDAVNNIDGVWKNLPKPTLYSLFVVPEDPERLGAVRVLLADAARLPGHGLLVSHDQLQLEASGVPPW